MISPLAGEMAGRPEGGASAPAPPVSHHEAFLVGADRQPDDLVGDVEEFLLELAHQRHRPFDEAGDLFEQPLVLDQLEAAGEGEIVGVLPDHVLAPLGVEHDLGLFELVDVVVEALDRDRLARCP